MEHEQDFEFVHRCKECGVRLKTVVSVEASKDYWGELHFVVEEELKDVEQRPCPL